MTTGNRRLDSPNRSDDRRLASPRPARPERATAGAGGPINFGAWHPCARARAQGGFINVTDQESLMTARPRSLTSLRQRCHSLIEFMSESIELSRLPSGLHAALERQVSNGSRASSSSKGNVAASSSRQPQRPLESPSADDVRVAVGEETEAIIPPAGSEGGTPVADVSKQSKLTSAYSPIQPLTRTPTEEPKHGCKFSTAFASFSPLSEASTCGESSRMPCTPKASHRLLPSHSSARLKRPLKACARFHFRAW